MNRKDLLITLDEKYVHTTLVTKQVIKNPSFCAICSSQINWLRR